MFASNGQRYKALEARRPAMTTLPLRDQRMAAYGSEPEKHTPSLRLVSGTGDYGIHLEFEQLGEQHRLVTCVAVTA
jgi:hypothetical protein